MNLNCATLAITAIGLIYAIWIIARSIWEIIETGSISVFQIGILVILLVLVIMFIKVILIEHEIMKREEK